MALRPLAIGLPAMAVALAAIGAWGSRDEVLHATRTTELTLIYVGAADCAPCRAWHREQWPKFRASKEFERLQFRAVESPNLLDLLKDEHWPEDLRAYRDQLEAGAGVPLWLVAANHEVIFKAYGASQWSEAVLPAIQHMVR